MSAVADDVIFHLDVAQEERVLTDEERELWTKLKDKLLGISALDRIRWRQRSRISWIKEGDANTRFFHFRANGRRCKNHIPSLVGASGAVTEHEEKAKILLKHYTELMGTFTPAAAELNWDSIGLPSVELSHLDTAFTIEELKKAVHNMHGEKAPGPDGYIGSFYKKCWNIVKVDLLAALNQMHLLKGDQWHLLNTANIVFCPKRMTPWMQGIIGQ